MYRKTLWTFISLLVIAAFVLTACQPQSTPAPAETQAPAATEAQPAAGEEIALRWRTRPDNQAEIDVYQQASDAIDAKMDGITPTYEPGGSESPPTRMCSRPKSLPARLPMSSGSPAPMSPTLPTAA